jgi:hypothetical protein
MLDKCANQNCEEKFKYFGEGKLFLRNVNAVFTMSRDELVNECYWLCPACATEFKVEFVNEGIRVVALMRRAA